MTSASNEQVSQASHSVQGQGILGGATHDDGAESSLSQQPVVDESSLSQQPVVDESSLSQQPVVDEARACTPPPDVPERASSPDAHGSTGPAPSVSRPTDEDIVQQQNQIRSEEASKVPYVGDQEPLVLLKQEYSAGNLVFVHKIGQMEARGYRTLRRTAGDGNCFFRGFIFGYLESILLFHDAQERDRFATLVRAWKPKLVEQDYQELVFEDAQDILLDLLAAIARGHEPMLLEALECNFRDDRVSNMIVMYLRLVTAAEIKRRQEFFMPFILGMYDDPPATIEMFLQRHVECMGEESDHIHIVAISEALQVPIRVVYLDRSGAQSAESAGSDADINCHNFVPEGMPADSIPRVHLLYRPGHFDVLYLGA